MNPNEINAKFDEAVYHCRACKTDKNLHWFLGTSCPVCDKLECQQKLRQEWAEAYGSDLEDFAK